MLFVFDIFSVNFTIPYENANEKKRKKYNDIELRAECLIHFMLKSKEESGIGRRSDVQNNLEFQ